MVGRIRLSALMAPATPEALRSQMREIVDQAADLVELQREIEEKEIVLNPDYAYPAYGIPSDETNDAIRLAAQTEAMITDPVYEGKSMQALIDLARKGFSLTVQTSCFVHLGGAPAINGYSDTYRDG